MGGGGRSLYLSFTARTNSSIEGQSRPEEGLSRRHQHQRLEANGSLDYSDTESEDLTQLSWEGTFVIPKSVSTYLSKHLRRYLTKKEQEALFKTHTTNRFPGN